MVVLFVDGLCGRFYSLGGQEISAISSPVTVEYENQQVSR